MVDARQPTHVARTAGSQYPCSCDATMDHTVGHEVLPPHGYKVTCDESNNRPEDIAKGELYIDIVIQPVQGLFRVTKLPTDAEQSQIRLHKGRPVVADVQPLMWAYRDSPGGNVGGNLHIILDDGNIRDKDIKHCRDVCRHRHDLAGLRLCELLLQMSKSQRARLAHSFYSNGV